jgi:signal transduction histidine kinase
MFRHIEGRGAKAAEEEKTTASWQTTRAGVGGQMSYAARVTISFALTATMTVLILTIVLAVVWEQQFSSYTRANMETVAQSYAAQLAEEYEQAGGWTDEILNGVSSPSSSIGVQVIDVDGTIIYDDTWEEAETVFDSAGERVGGTRSSRAPTDAEATVSAPITTSDGEQIGTIRLWAYGSDALLTSEDIAFRSNSYKAILIAAIFAIALSVVIGAVFARSLSRPVKRITSAAAAIREGDLTARSGVRGEDEIGQLGETFDDMATTLERDLKLEHRLTSDVAHELRTPLMAMLATVEAMQDGVLPSDDEHLAVVASEVRRLSRLVDAMLQLSRMENGTASFKPTDVDMVGLVRSLVTAQEQLFADNDLTLTFHDDDAPEDEYLVEDENVDREPHAIWAKVDRDMMNQAITNLLSNALRYTPAGGKVDVHIHQEKGDVLISVSDTGIGIAPEDLSRVFSRFWRSDASRERASGGLGVGLSLTKHIIDRHHGYIAVESEVGKGTTFTLHIPVEYRDPRQPRRLIGKQGETPASESESSSADDTGCLLIDGTAGNETGPEDMDKPSDEDDA